MGLVIRKGPLKRWIQPKTFRVQWPCCESISGKDSREREPRYEALMCTCARMSKEQKGPMSWPRRPGRQPSWTESGPGKDLDTAASRI